MNLARSIVRETVRLWYGSRRPVREGTVPVSDLERELEIGRDEFGVPYLAAAQERDLWYGLGRSKWRAHRGVSVKTRR